VANPVTTSTVVETKVASTTTEVVMRIRDMIPTTPDHRTPTILDHKLMVVTKELAVGELLITI